MAPISIVNVALWGPVVVLLVMAVIVDVGYGFAVIPQHIIHKVIKPTTPTTLYIEDWVADMIDSEIYRQQHKSEYETEWMKKNKDAVLQSLRTETTNAMLSDDVDGVNKGLLLRDKRMAKNDPQRYCADRCIATGNCDVYEDIFDFTPEEVMAFCNDCVLAEDEDKECEIPDSFYDNLLLP